MLMRGCGAGPYADEFKRYSQGAAFVTFALNDREADVHLQSASFNLYETSMLIRTPVGVAEIVTGLLGRHHVQNILAAVAAGLALEIPLRVSRPWVLSICFGETATLRIQRHLPICLRRALSRIELHPDTARRSLL